MSASSLGSGGSVALSIKETAAKNDSRSLGVDNEEKRGPGNLQVDVDREADGESLLTNEQLLERAEAEAMEERYFIAARLIQRVSDPTLLRPKHTHIVEIAEQCERVVVELTAHPDVPDEDDHPGDTHESGPRHSHRRQGRPPKHGWKKQGELHQHDHESGGRTSSSSSLGMDTLLYYKVHDASSAISCRIDSTLDPTLLVPLLSVFNESDLYATWMPSWRHPKLGVRTSTKLAEKGRGNQVIHVTADMPFPITDRECVLHGCAVDDIDERASIVIKMRSLDVGEHSHHPLGGSVTVPPPERGSVRVDLDAGMLIRACPPDHPVLLERVKRCSRHHPQSAPDGSSSAEEADDHVLLFSLYQQVDANVRLVPMSLINFFTRTVLSRMWHTLIHVATEVRGERRPDHQTAIRSNPDLYEWIERRVEVMLGNVKEAEAAAASRSGPP